jgi:hypothetical protein
MQNVNDLGAAVQLGAIKNVSKMTFTAADEDGSAVFHDGALRVASTADAAKCE